MRRTIDHVAVIGVTRVEGVDEPLVLNGLRKPAPIVLLLQAPGGDHMTSIQIRYCEV